MSDHKKKIGFEDLPNEILLMVAENLETARDVSALSKTSRTVHQRIDTTWQAFVRSRFPSMNIPIKKDAKTTDWKGLAESLTYQSKCWERRSLRFTALYPVQPTRRTKGLAFKPVIDVDHDMDSNREMVIWGAGEDIVARYRTRGRAQAQSGTTSWHTLSGAAQGLRAAYDDVMSMDIVNLPHLKGPAVVVGRAADDTLSLLSAQSDSAFGQQLATFSPVHASGPIKGAEGRDLTQNSLSDVNVLNEKNEGLVAACSNLGVWIYRLPQDSSETNIAPVELYNLAPDVPQRALSTKWMGSPDLLAVAIQGRRDPLRYLTRTPTGWTISSAAKNARVEARFDLSNAPIYPSSLQPIHLVPGNPTPTPLLLSSWRDNTIRLQDIRTPNPFDTVFQDNINTIWGFGSLLPFGASHFIAGGMDGATLEFFDFRWPKAYFHTTALPCGDHEPFPSVPQHFVPKPKDRTEGRPCCNYARGLRCRWHEAASDLYYRPNALVMLSMSLPRQTHRSTRVCSLAKGSDVSPNFYVGVTGGIIEASLGSAVEGTFDRHLGFPEPKAHPSAAYSPMPLSAAMMEIGDGLMAQTHTRNLTLPRFHSMDGKTYEGTEWEDRVDSGWRKKHRLDETYQYSEDFWGPQRQAWDYTVDMYGRDD